MLSPHTFLLGILFHDDAFRPPGIKSMEDLRRLFLEGGRQQMPVPLRRDKADHYVFCHIEGIRGKIQIHRKQPISQSSLSQQLKKFGEIAGFKWSLFTHRFRYGGGTILNESGECWHMPMAPWAPFHDLTLMQRVTALVRACK